MTRIAVVEDDVDTSRTIADALRLSGHETVSYFHPTSDILQHVKTYRPDLVILDARLDSPVTGWDIVRSLKEDPQTHDIPLIVCTGATREVEEHRAMLEEYNVPVLAKPFDLSELEDTVAHLLSAGQ